MTAPSAASTITCPECGRTYTCDPAGACWCRNVDIRLPMPQDADTRCLCPCKLEALANAAKPARQ